MKKQIQELLYEHIYNEVGVTKTKELLDCGFSHIKNLTTGNPTLSSVENACSKLNLKIKIKKGQ